MYFFLTHGKKQQSWKSIHLIHRANVCFFPEWAKRILRDKKKKEKKPSSNESRVIRSPIINVGNDDAW